MRSERRPWYRIDLFAALQRLRLVLRRWREDDSRPEHNPLQASLELHSLDQRNPPSEALTTVILPLAALSAELTADAYHAAALAAEEEQAARSLGEPAQSTTTDFLEPWGPLDQPAGEREAVAGEPAMRGFPATGRARSGETDGDFWQADQEWSSNFLSIPLSARSGGQSAGDAGASGFAGIPITAPIAPPPSSGSAGDTTATTGLLASSAFATSVPAGGLTQAVAPVSSESTTSVASASENILSSTGDGSSIASTEPDPSATAGDRPGSGQPSLLGDLADQPARFVANEGQWGESIDFGVRVEGYQASFGRDGVGLALARSATAADVARGVARDTSAAVFDVVRLSWQGVRPGAQAIGEDRLASVSNFLKGNDPSAWRSGVPEYSAVRYAGAWDGIDVVYKRADGRGLEYDLVVTPGASAAGASFRVEGATPRVDAAGRLVLTTPGGAVLATSAPVLYQLAADGRREPVAGGYERRPDGTIGFAVGPHDPGRELVIDPVLEYSATIGGSFFDDGRGVAVDAEGNAFLVGSTSSTDFPVTTGAFDTTLDGDTDAFAAKFDADGNVVWATYFGGSDGAVYDYANAVALRGDGVILVAGATGSSDYPITSGAYDQSFTDDMATGGEAFLTAFSADGTTLVYSTYLGGSQSE